MAVTTVLLLTAVVQTVVAVRDDILTTRQLHTALCVGTVAHRYFTPGRPLAISLPHRYDLQMVNAILEKLNDRTRWPIEVFRQSGDGSTETSVLHNSYILFVWIEREIGLNETLGKQLDNLKYSTSWNPRGRFLVVVTGDSDESPQLVAGDMFALLWQVTRIVNVVVLISSQSAYRPLNATISTQATHPDSLNLYIWFPFTLGRCGEAQAAILQDQWVFENNGRFLLDAHLYPARVPKHFTACPIKVGTAGVDPYVILTGNYSHSDGSTEYKLTGLSVKILKLVCEKMNLKTVFLPPSLNVELDSFWQVLCDLKEGLADVLTGIFPLMSLIVSLDVDATIPFTHANLKMTVPCPKAVAGIERILTTFSLSVWLTMCLVLLLTASVFWCVSNGPHRSVTRGAHSRKSLSHCFYTAWAVFIGVSVPQQPTTSNLRAFFLLYVCYSLAMSTVFQALFVSFLVEPEYEKRIETFDEFLDADLVYGDHPGTTAAADNLLYSEFTYFHKHKKLQEDCTDTRKCVERMITEGDIGIPVVTQYTAYVAKQFGIVDVSKVMCPFEESIISASVTILFQKGSPLLDRFNTLIRRCLESGLLEKYWSELQHGAALRGTDRLREASRDMFVAFSVSHLMSAFAVLVVGNVLGSAVFITELISNYVCKRIR